MSRRMKTARLESVDLTCRRQRVRLFLLACAGIVAFCIVFLVVVPRICPATVRFRARFSSGRLTANPTTTTWCGLHYISATGPFDRTRCTYVKIGRNIWFLEARTPIEQ